MPRAAQEIPLSLASGDYTIRIDAGWLPQLANRYRSLFDSASKTLIVSDSHVRPLHAETLSAGLRGCGIAAELLEIPAGEQSKSIVEASRLWEALLQHGADRKSLVLALGGGMVGDLVGFVAATYARGIAYVQVPTSLVAQVDSSIGGKVGINLPSAKNMVGCFWHPALVAIDVDLLRTLPNREYISGWGEVVKYGMALDVDLFEYLEIHAQAIHARDSATLMEIVHRCCALKAQIVTEDERDLTGRRAILNYGHTFAHAIEACGGYGEWLHGEAVAMGMHCAARLARRMGWCGQGDVDRQAALLQTLDLPISLPSTDPQSYVTAMLRDKKSERGAIRCVLPNGIGRARLSEPINLDDLRAILNHG